MNETPAKPAAVASPPSAQQGSPVKADPKQTYVSHSVDVHQPVHLLPFRSERAIRLRRGRT